MVDQGYCATYRELWNEVGLAARGLLARGVRKGDRVGIWSPNRAEWTVTQLATARIGAILVTINPAYKAAGLQYAASYCFWRPARAPRRVSRWVGWSASQTASRAWAMAASSLGYRCA